MEPTDYKKEFMKLFSLKEGDKIVICSREINLHLLVENKTSPKIQGHTINSIIIDEAV